MTHLSCEIREAPARHYGPSHQRLFNGAFPRLMTSLPAIVEARRLTRFGRIHHNYFPKTPYSLPLSIVILTHEIVVIFPHFALRNNEMDSPPSLVTNSTAS